MSQKPPRKRSRRVRGGALLLTSILMIGSATLRLGVQAGPAITREMSHTSPKPAMPTEEPHRVTATSDDMQLLLTTLQEREQQLNRRETQIEDRMKALEIADGAIERKLQALVEAEARLGATLALADGASEEDLTRLTDVYEKMKAKDAAALFEEMAPEFAAGFLGRMRPTSAANVMAGLSPKAAYTISVILAGRNATVPKE
ncbi:MAG: flagellar motility protein MotE (MotC chaperone) [Paracoccaceae bacterium]|jgi:flagellar motility protein MotE (MotC chaperone)